MPKNYIRKYLSDDDLDTIVKKIYEAESKTSGEIRLSIKTKRGYREKDLSPRKLAIAEFLNLRMNETRDKTGVLFYILFDEHRYEIIADSGINSKITDQEWNSLTADITEYFKNEKYLEGILFVIEKIGNKLTEEFPIKSGDINELPNEVSIS
ncbi:MAG: TPM domain-containing protein [Ignavibacteria bacterium]|nr:TPM domain-containing protein [Ignavibacteria bacterium]